MNTKKIVSFIFLSLLLLNFTFITNFSQSRSSSIEQSVTVIIETVWVIEDRDSGAGEIYLNSSFNNTMWEKSATTSVNDGDNISLNWIFVEKVVGSNFNLSIGVWDDDHIDTLGDNVDDFLGWVNISRSSLESRQEWYNATNPIGGNNAVQAKIFIKEIVETANPQIINNLGFDSIQITSEDSNINLNWSVSDFSPYTYQILRNGSLVNSGVWSNDFPIIYNIDILLPGTYNFTLVVFDTDLTWNSSTVLVSVDSDYVISGSSSSSSTGSSGISDTSESQSDNSSSEDDTPNRTIPFTDPLLLLISILSISTIGLVRGRNK